MKLTMEPDFYCIILLVLVSICNGENCQAHYKVYPICGTYYGIVLIWEYGAWLNVLLGVVMKTCVGLLYTTVDKTNVEQTLNTFIH